MSLENAESRTSKSLDFMCNREIFLFVNWRVAALVTSSLVALRHFNTTHPEVAFNFLIPRISGYNPHVHKPRHIYHTYIGSRSTTGRKLRLLFHWPIVNHLQRDMPRSRLQIDDWADVKTIVSLAYRKQRYKISMARLWTKCHILFAAKVWRPIVQTVLVG